MVVARIQRWILLVASYQFNTRLYTWYRSYLGADMTENLCQAALEAYSSIANRFLPIPSDNVKAVAPELKAEAFVLNAHVLAVCIYQRRVFWLN